VVSRRSRIEWWALVAEIAGGLAVVISVIYLAVQINDNTRMLRSQSHYNALDVLHSPGEIVLENADLASLMVRCNSEPDSVSVDEWERCRWFYFLQMNGWEYTYYQNLERTIPEQLWFGVDGVMRQYVAHRSGYARFWNETAIGFAEPFRSYVATVIESNPYFARHQGEELEAELHAPRAES
jgi:hypothetical protein